MKIKAIEMRYWCWVSGRTINGVPVTGCEYLGNTVYGFLKLILKDGSEKLILPSLGKYKPSKQCVEKHLDKKTQGYDNVN